MIVRVLTAFLLVLYPFAIWQLLENNHIKAAAIVLAVTSLLSAWSKRTTIGLICAGVAFVLAASAVIFDLADALKLYPVFVNVMLLLVFATSLRRMPVVEKLARLREKHLPPYAVSYCRRVTAAWCVFFAINGLIALDSALFRSDAWWGLYNGAISYALIGLMFVIEFIVRLYVRRKHKDSGELT